MGTVRDLLKVNEKVLKSFYRWTGYAVLLLICLHPGILIIQRFLMAQAYLQKVINLMLRRVLLG